VCGNGVLEPGEVCDAPDDGPCPAGTCAGDCDCTPAVCGDDVIELGEQCDGTEDSACPGECGAPADPDACLCPNADSCATPRDVVVFPYADTQDTSGATVAPSDPLLTCGSTSIQQAHSVWYRVVAPANGTIAADTFGSSYDTVLAAHTGTCGSLVPVPGACNDDSAGYQSEIGFPVTGGSAYLLEVTSYSTTSGGTLQLHVDFVGAATPTPTATPTATPTLVPGCAAAPDVCRTPTVGGKAAVALIDQTLDQKDQLQWKWLNGAATTASEFGNPTATTAYDLCLYDGSGLRASIAVPAGTFCAGKPCWAAKPTGFTYKDKTLAAGGLAQIALKAGIAGKAKIQVKGKGVNLPMPALATLTSPLTVELKAAAAATCWSARYAFPPAVKNDGVQFKDKAD
jgi:hypothetical protein